MSREGDSGEIKNLLLRLVKTVEELKSAFGPLVKGQDYAKNALEAHNDVIQELMGATVTLKREQETLHKELDELKDYSVDHKLFQELEDRVKTLEIASLSRVVRKLKLSKEIGKTELGELESLVERKPEDPDLWLTLGLVYFKKDQIKKSLECFTKVIQIDSKNVHAWCSKGVALGELKKYDEALKAFQTARKLSECPIIFRHEAYTMALMDKKERALELVDLAIQGDKEDGVSWALKGRILKELDRDMEALGCLEKALELQPNLDVALTDKGAILSTLGPEYYKDALNCFNKVVQLTGGSEAWHNKGLMLLRLDREKEALECFDKAIELEETACSYCGRGVSKQALGDTLGALKDFSRAQEIGIPEDCTIFYASKSLVLEKLERYEEALKIVEKGLTIRSDVRELWIQKASVLVDLEKPDEAKKCIETAVKLQPTDALDLNNIAYALYELGEPSQALDFSQEAVKKRPNAGNLDTLACVLSELGRHEEALQSFEKALELRVSDTDITWSALEKLYSKMGKKEQAERIRKEHLK